MCESLLSVSREQSGLLVALMGISSTLTRPLVGLLADCEKFNPLIIYSVGCIGAAIFAVCIPWAPTFTACLGVLFEYFEGDYFYTMSTLSAAYTISCTLSVL